MQQLTKDQMDKRIEAMRVRAMLRLEANEGYVKKLNDILPAVEADRERLGQDGRRKRVKDLNLTTKSFGVKTPRQLDEPRS